MLFVFNVHSLVCSISICEAIRQQPFLQASEGNFAQGSMLRESESLSQISAVTSNRQAVWHAQLDLEQALSKETQRKVQLAKRESRFRPTQLQHVQAQNVVIESDDGLADGLAKQMEEDDLEQQKPTAMSLQAARDLAVQEQLHNVLQQHEASEMRRDQA